MRIAFDHQTFTLQKYGGISRYITELTQELENLEQEAKVFSPFYFNHYLHELDESLKKGYHVNSFPYHTGRLAMIFNHFVGNHWVRKWKADIVHETYYSDFPAPGFSVPRVITVHDMIHEIYAEHFSKKEQKFILWKKKSLERVDKIICISENTKKDLINLYDIDETKIDVVYHGVAPGLIKGEGSTLPADVVDTPFILFVGSRDIYKNFELLLKAFSKSDLLKKNFKIVTFGGGGFTSSERNQIADLGIDSSQVLNFSGSDGLLTSLYRKAITFVYPSKYEGFGMPPLEAMACDCPVISSNSSSLPEVVGDAGLLFDPSSEEELIECIEKVVDSDELQEGLILKGRERVADFTWKKCAENTLQVYKSIS